MIRRSEGMWVQQHSPEPSAPPLPADHVLLSGAVSFPGAFDQLGSPLVVFPVAGQAQISSTLSKAEVVDFINYCLFQHHKTQKSSLVSVVADLREASASSARFIAETLLLLELQKRTVHSVYIIQPKKREVLRLLVKLWTSSKSHPVTFKKVLLKDVFELSNYIDRSQLPPSLGGYLVYCHQSWANFTKEMDGFSEHFMAVAQRLPGSLSSLQTLGMTPMPSALPELQLFCSTNEARFKQLQRELGLEELLKHCELLQDKLRTPELDPHFQSMAGTALFTQHFSIMMQKHRRITAAMKKVELIWQEAFSKARLQLHVLQLRDAALQITEQIESLLQQKLQPFNIQIAEDVTEAERQALEFHSSVYSPAMSLVARAEEVILTLTEALSDAPSRERWLLDLHRLKEKLHSTVHVTLQTLQAVCKYHKYYFKAHTWYLLVLSENFLQKMLSDVDRRRQKRSFGTLPTWRKKLSTFLKSSPPPSSEELVHLAHLSNVIPDKRLHKEGMQLSQRCMTLKRLIYSSEPLTVAELQVALQWQYELLRSSLVNRSFSPAQHVQHSAERNSVFSAPPLRQRDSQPTAADQLRPGSAPEGKPSSLSSFDSGFDGAGSLLEGPAVTPDFGNRAGNQPQIQEETASGISDSECFGSLGNSSRASVRLGSKAALDELNLEIKVKRSAAHPSNPWLSLPDDDLENAYTVTITPKPKQFSEHGDLPPVSPTVPPTGLQLHSPCSLEESELGPIVHVLSSTITESRDQSITTGGPSMLWDSYDLHEQHLEAADGVSALSLKDWDIKEQENLTEVERILERADKILTEEENVLAQEAELDDLLQTEVDAHPWTAWNNPVSLAELTLAHTVILDQVEEESQSDPDLNSQNESWKSRPDLLTELKEVQALDQRILEEEVKIQQLREEESIDVDMMWTSNTKNGRNRRSPPINESLEQMNLSRNGSEGKSQAPNSQRRAAIVVRCSIMSRTDSEEDGDLCDGLLSGQRSSEEPDSEAESGVRSRSSSCNKSDLNIIISEEGLSSETVLGSISTGLQENAERSSGALDFSVTDLPAAQKTLPLNMDSDNILEKTRALHPQPIPKPRKKTSLTQNQLGEELSEDKRVSLEDTENMILSPDRKGGSLAQDTGECRLSSEDSREGVTEEALPHEDPGEGGVHFEDIRNKDALAKDTKDMCVSPRNSDKIKSPSDNRKNEADNNADKTVISDAGVKPLCKSLNVDLHSNNNNNNCLASLISSGEDVSDETEIEDRFDPPYADTGPPAYTPVYNLKDNDENLSERTKMSAPVIQDEFNINTTLPSDLKTPIVLDTGSGLMKAGFADQDLPSVVFPTIIGLPKYEEIMNGSTEKDLYVGHEAQHMRGVLALRYPIKHGLIHNWDDMEKIWQHSFDHLRVDPADHPVLLTEAPLNPLKNKQRAMEIMFEFFGVPYSYIALQAVLALYAAGRTTGVVLDSGNGVTHCVPVYDGYTLPHAVQRFPLAGADVTANLTKLLQEQGVCMRTSAEQEIVREIKEKCCCVALDYEAELREGGACREMSYTLPDGRTVTLGLERIRAPEILFKPELIGQDHYGLHESVYKSILKSDLDLRRCFLGNILLSGGNTLLPGLPERLEAELSRLVPHEPRSSVRVCSPSDRDFSVWCGGAVLANLPSFCAAWISQGEYDEYGPQIVHRKCF